MRLTLVHNAAAGDGSSERALRRDIAQAGHQLVQDIAPDELAPDLAIDGELLLVAGGDGTVRRAATAVVGRGIPIAILPSGTANNVATSLGLPARPADALGRLTRAPGRSLDLGHARTAAGDRRFIEGVGVGLVAAGIETMDRRPIPPDELAGDAIARALDCFRRVLDAMAPRRMSLELDGEELTGEFLMIEVHNMTSVGPNLVIAPDADPGDGWLDVVVATARDRDALARYLDARREGQPHPAPLELPSRRAREVVLHDADRAHIDDEVLDVGRRVALTLERGALELRG